VIDKELEYMTEYSANIHRGVYDISERASEEYEAVREKVAGLIGGKTEEIIFTKNATESINLVVNSLPKIDGDIVVTRLEHHANFVPWQRLATKINRKFIILELDSNLEPVTKSIDWKKVGILAITQVSNVVGTVVDLKQIITQAKKVNPKLIVIVDGCQAVAHMKVDVADLGCDFYVFSGHKMYGPTGVGVLWGKMELLEKMEPFLVGGGMIAKVGDVESTWAAVPEKFEAGTPPIAQVIALGAALDFVNKLDWTEVQKAEQKLVKYCKEELKKVDGVRVFCAPSSVSAGIFRD
jgi:cysteine desulfurase/selenocysteine lyase